MNLRLSECVLWTGLALALSASMSQAAEPSRGELLVHRWCSNCHATDDSIDATDSAPSLNAIARKNRNNPDWVASWLANPHPPMPNFNLSKTDVDDIQSYLRSLTGEREKANQVPRINTSF